MLCSLSNPRDDCLDRFNRDSRYCCFLLLPVGATPVMILKLSSGVKFTKSNTLGSLSGLSPSADIDDLQPLADSEGRGKFVKGLRRRGVK